MQRRYGTVDAVIYAILLVFGVTTLYPLWHIFVISISTDEAFFASWYHIVPRSFTVAPYVYNFRQPQLVRSLAISIWVTAVGASVSVLVTAMAAYTLSKSHLKGRVFLFRLFIFTMFFQGGVIPLYVLVNRLGLRDTLPVLFLPTLIHMFNLLITKNYFSGMADSIEESAKIDGANDVLIFFRIILPISRPIVMTIGLFYAVQFWNDWFNGLLYISNQRFIPLALYLRGIIASAITTEVAAVTTVQTPATIRAAAVIITLTPIVLFYPFIQKYFVKGVMLGSTKE